MRSGVICPVYTSTSIKNILKFIALHILKADIKFTHGIMTTEFFF